MFLPSNITLKFGDSGDFVAELQRRLVMVGCFQDSMVNGFFDGPTVNGVIAFQGRHGLHADGVAGPETLRRLSGVISGDTGSTATDTKQEEEKPYTPAPPIQQFSWGQTPVDPFAEAVMATAAQTVVAPETAPAIESARPEPALRPEPPPMQHAPMPVTPQPSGLDMLAAMVQGTPEQQPLAQRPPLHGHGVQPNPSQAMSGNPQAMNQQPGQPGADVAQNTPQAPQGIIGRTMQFANAMMQRLSDYFSAKLPASVLDQVHAIGHHMAQSGVREVPIPGAPEPARTAELPGRGQEHQQQPHRG